LWNAYEDIADLTAQAMNHYHSWWDKQWYLIVGALSLALPCLVMVVLVIGECWHWGEMRWCVVEKQLYKLG
jgi:hypothetical protein